MSERRHSTDRDPALEIFHQLPTVEVAPGEIEAMKDAVAAMRRADRHTAPRRARRQPAWARAAAVAAVLITGVLLRGAAPPVDGPQDLTAATGLSVTDPSMRGFSTTSPSAEMADYAVYVNQLPLTDGLEEPVLQFHDEGLSLVFVTSENLDV